MRLRGAGRQHLQKTWASSCWKRRTRVRPCRARAELVAVQHAKVRQPHAAAPGMSARGAQTSGSVLRQPHASQLLAVCSTAVPLPDPAQTAANKDGTDARFS